MRAAAALLPLLLLLVAGPGRAGEPPDDPIAARIAGFKAVKAAVGRIDDALDADALPAAAEEAGRIATFAAIVPTLFPPGSEQGGDTNASAALWRDFAGFTIRAEELRHLAADLATAATAGDRATATARLRDLRGTCRGCHRRYQDLW